MLVVKSKSLKACVLIIINFFCPLNLNRECKLYSIYAIYIQLYIFSISMFKLNISSLFLQSENLLDAVMCYTVFSLLNVRMQKEVLQSHCWSFFLFSALGIAIKNNDVPSGSSVLL